jgi:hypothetical protein
VGLVVMEMSDVWGGWGTHSRGPALTAVEDTSSVKERRPSSPHDLISCTTAPRICEEMWRTNSHNLAIKTQGFDRISAKCDRHIQTNKQKQTNKQMNEEKHN